MAKIIPNSFTRGEIFGARNFKSMPARFKAMISQISCTTPANVTALDSQTPAINWVELKYKSDDISVIFNNIGALAAAANRFIPFNTPAIKDTNEISIR